MQNQARFISSTLKTEQRFHTYTIQVITTICPKQQLGILQASKQQATASQHENKRHGHDVQVKHNKT